MGILDLLEASAEGTSAQVKRELVDSCLASPSQLHGIADALMTTKGKLQLDAAEVLAEIAKVRPELVATHVPSIMRIADEKNAKTSKVALGAMAAAAHVDPSGVARYQKDLETMAKGGKLAESALSVLGHLGTASPRWAGAVRPVLLTYLARTEPERLPGVIAAIAPAFLPNAERELQAALTRRLAGVDPALAEKAQDAVRKAARKKKTGK
jgi:hypothetical protein